MSASFERLIDGMVEALQAHVLPGSHDDFARGQIFSVIFALNGLKLAADWKTGPLLEQIRLQDDAFAAVRRLADGMSHPPLPVTRLTGGIVDAATVESLRDEGDRKLGELLLWATGEDARTADRSAASEIEMMLRRLICDQLKVELATTPKLMLQQIAGERVASGAN
ncbi:hypothetical protein [Bradyrhizobium sp. Leo170]|uniref:hypothetical protein n=1 Tax=Bradyrhizobium sp. Leo170 TaxID=1571199 RepID=UPI00102E3368|nr:hypothetical protein [Bradyrhizobium sp. Leo170]TAI66199.1 hypothetical protein CWO89_09510 [Bradyrhizobium sp. Leo170]